MPADLREVKKEEGYFGPDYKTARIISWKFRALWLLTPEKNCDFWLTAGGVIPFKTQPSSRLKLR